MDDNLPILIGCGQVTVRDEPLDALSTPMDLMQGAAKLAVADAGLSEDAMKALDALVKSFREPMRNSPEVLARRLGADQARCWLTPDGGSTPQALVNLFADRTARDEAGLVLLTGAEAIDNARRLIKSDEKLRWSEPSDSDPEFIFPDREMWTEPEKAHGLWQASLVYLLFENAYRGHLGRSIEGHQHAMGEPFAPFTKVASGVEHAWFRQERSAEEIATATASNRYVGWPFTKFMNAMNQINQSAALLLTSVGRAKALGISATG
jgi:acetyl-CoA C-acetyltransferase